MESPYLIEKFHGIPWNYGNYGNHGTWSDTKIHGTLVPPNGLSPSYIEFHGNPWTSGAAKWNITQFHGIPFQMGGISKGRHFKWHKCSKEFHGIFTRRCLLHTALSAVVLLWYRALFVCREVLCLFYSIHMQLSYKIRKLYIMKCYTNAGKHKIKYIHLYLMCNITNYYCKSNFDRKIASVIL